MSLCGKCRKNPWPYALVVFISTFVAFMTWLTLSLTGLTPDARVLLTAGAFLTAVVILLSYMISCMRRHCSDDQHTA